MENAMTWDEVADDYDKIFGGTARTLPLDEVFNALAELKDKYYVSEDGSIFRRGE